MCSCFIEDRWGEDGRSTTYFHDYFQTVFGRWSYSALLFRRLEVLRSISNAWMRPSSGCWTSLVESLYVFLYSNSSLIFSLLSEDLVLKFQAPRPSCGPHKQRESLPLIVFLRNRLNYALTGDEVKKILMQRLIKVNGRVRTDPTFSAGFMGKL